MYEYFASFNPVHLLPTDLAGQLGSDLVAAVEDLLVVVHPDLSQAHLVAGDDLGAFREGVGALGAEHVAHHGTRKDLQLTTTLPNLGTADAEHSFKLYLMLYIK